MPASFWRGGTSRAVLLLESDLIGYSPDQVEAVILAALGSPDPGGRQVDGLGGGASSLSKAAIVGPAPAGSSADVAFRFAQVEVAAPRVDFTGNCGNISAAIGPFALEAGLVTAAGDLVGGPHRAPNTTAPFSAAAGDLADGPHRAPNTTAPFSAAAGGPADVVYAEVPTDVVVLSLNTGQRYRVRVPTRSGRYEPAGDFCIPGVPGSGSRIAIEYIDPAGSAGRGPLPTGAAQEEIGIGGGDGTVAVSIVDVGNPVVFVSAAAVGADDAASPDEIDADAGLCHRLEHLRREAAVRIGLAGSVEEAAKRPTIPKVAMVGPPAPDAAYTPEVPAETAGLTAMVTGPAPHAAGRGQPGLAEGIDVTVRLISMGRAHRTIAITGAMAAAASAALPGTVVSEAAHAVGTGGAGDEAADVVIDAAGVGAAGDGVAATAGAVRDGPGPLRPVRIGHPAGVLEIGVEVGRSPDGQWRVPRVTVDRTAREIMRGSVLVPESYLAGRAWFAGQSSR